PFPRTACLSPNYGWAVLRPLPLGRTRGGVVFPATPPCLFAPLPPNLTSCLLPEPFMSYAALDVLGRQLESIEHAIAILSADEATTMPVGGGAKRAEALAHLSGLLHETSTAPHVGDWLDAAENEDLSADQTLAVAEFRRVHTNATCLPTDFVRRQTE